MRSGAVIYFLKQRITIRRVLACLLLLLAVLGATPRQYLHHLFADHVDTDYGFRGKERAVGASVYQCGFHHQVTTSPVVPESAIQLSAPRAVVFVPFFIALHPSPVTGYVIISDGRGPPAATLV